MMKGDTRRRVEGKKVESSCESGDAAGAPCPVSALSGGTGCVQIRLDRACKTREKKMGIYGWCLHCSGHAIAAGQAAK